MVASPTSHERVSRVTVAIFPTFPLAAVGHKKFEIYLLLYGIMRRMGIDGFRCNLPDDSKNLRNSLNFDNPLYGNENTENPRCRF